MQQDLNDLYYYVHVVDHGGFAPAGRSLGMPKSRLSRRIALLEQRLGVRLIQRSTRSFSVTEVGQVYYARCKAMLVEADAAQTAIEAVHAEPCGTVRLSCPIALLHTHIGAMLVAFAAKFPTVTVEVLGMNRAVDVVGEGLDLALRMHPTPLEDNHLVVRVLGYAAQCLVASPSLVIRHGTPHEPVDLTTWPSLGYGRPPVEGHIWKLTGPEGAEAVQPHRPRFITTDMTTLRQAAVAGIGVVQLPVMMVKEQLADGSLVRVLPDWTPGREVIHVVFPTRRGLIPSVRALIDHLVEHLNGVEEG